VSTSAAGAWERTLISTSATLMGGRVAVHLRPADPSGFPAAERDGARVLRRIGTWADRLTRFTTTSDLARLNADPRDGAPIRPTLAAVVDWGRAAEGLSDGVVDITLLAERLQAEGLEPGDPPSPRGARRAGRWSLERRSRGALVRRPHGLRFDLDGVAKGWLADRALGLLRKYAAAVVDADGDIAIRLDGGESWRFGVADPRRPNHDLTVLELTGAAGPGGALFGLATSGTSVHRWVRDGHPTHHLIDPRSGRPARTDVVQASVLARSAREAEALAKTAVILGSAAALAALDRPGIDGALILTDRDELLLTPSTLGWLA
jgi:thiamine biosynthesis lipoprotein